MKRALLSVSDKTGIVDFAKGLERLGYQIVSTGGTLTTLLSEGVASVNISDITGFPECLDGRVKTLHPIVHAGILAMRDKKEHMDTLKSLDVELIEVVAINLYPFKKTIEKDDVTFEDAIENIDIGGPTMLRAAAKNYQDVYSICDSSDYNEVLKDIEEKTFSKELKKRLMRKVFSHTAQYDALISNYLNKQEKDFFPNNLTITFEKQQDMRYGENPQQKAAFYRNSLSEKTISIADGKQLMGKELSYNNVSDISGALEIIGEFTEPAAVAVKHANPCGVGTGKDIFEAYTRAYEGDKVSIFGGIVALNRRVEKELAEKMAEIFLEIVIAPSFSEESVRIFSEKRKNLRLIELSGIDSKERESVVYKKVQGGLLVQEADKTIWDEKDVYVAGKKTVSDKDMEELLFGFKVVKHTKSNAIVISKGNMTLGIGGGETNRIRAAEIALSQAGVKARGAYLSSDAFFPFSDTVELAAKYGIKAIIQPGGSVNDALSIKAADENGIAMVFCGSRHFKH